MRERPLRLAFSLAISILAMAARADAQVTDEPNPIIFPDPSKFAHGIYSEGEIGGLAFFGPAGSKVGPGFALGARLGYDITRWFAFQLHVLGSTHETTLSDMPEDGQLLQLFQGTGELKATVRFGQASIFVEGGAGAARLSSNILATLGLTRWRTGFTAGGGAGFDYHSLSRHFSIGLRAGYFWLRDISGSQDLTVTSYLRYTF